MSPRRTKTVYIPLSPYVDIFYNPFISEIFFNHYYLAVIKGFFVTHPS